MATIFAIKRHKKFALSVVVSILVCALFALSSIRYHVDESVFLGTEYHFLSLDDDNVNANQLGGAQKYITFNNKSYCVFACYYSIADANAVQSKLRILNIDCDVLSVSANIVKIDGLRAKVSKNLCLEMLGTLHSLSKIAYECANSMASRLIDADRAKSVILDVAVACRGLLKLDIGKRFFSGIEKILYECDFVLSGEIKQADLRGLQILICEKIINFAC